MKLTTNFQLEELVHPEIYDRIGSRSFDFLNPLLPLAVQGLRDEFGSITVNDWVWGGNFINSGLRMPNYPDGFAELSSHRFGCAADCKFADADPLQVQLYIKSHADDFPYITRMENAEITKTWLHVEVGKRGNNIIIFNP